MKNRRIIGPERGFSLVDLMVVIVLIGTVSAIAIPSMINAIDQMKLGQSARDVERELQTAKMRAVGKGRPIRVRFNCPAPGEFRIVELIGSTTVPVAADAATNRCSETVYPFPAADSNPVTRPNLDGPLRRLEQSVSFTVAPTIEFWTDGTAHYDTGGGSPWPMIPVTGINVRVSRNGVVSTVTVNGLGKVQLQTNNQ